MNIPWEKIEKTNNCWNWLGYSYKNYGKMFWKGKTIQAHRFIYEEMINKIPEGLELDHLCRNTLCVNPKHLQPVTRKENIKRAMKFRKTKPSKTHCKQGHKFLPENKLKITSRKNPKNICKICKSAIMKKYNLRKKMEEDLN